MDNAKKHKKILGLNPLMWLLIVVFVFLQYELWFQSDGILKMMSLHHQVAAQDQKNAQLEQKNSVLTSQVSQLQNSTAAVEASARNELGMIKKGETYYRVVQ